MDILFLNIEQQKKLSHSSCPLRRTPINWSQRQFVLKHILQQCSGSLYGQDGKEITKAEKKEDEICKIINKQV